MIGFICLLSITVFLVLLVFYPFYLIYNTESSFITLIFFHFIPFKFNINNLHKNRKRNLWSNINFRKRGVNSVIKSFKLISLHISIDTGNYQLNGILYPLFFLISFLFKKNISVNFVGKNYLHLILKNNLARLSWAYFSSK